MPVAWGVPMDEVLYGKWFVNFMMLPYMPWDTFISTQSTYLPDARNYIHQNFLQTEAEYLVMLDSDVMPPPEFLDKLLAHKKPFVAGWYRRKGHPYNPVVYEKDNGDTDKGMMSFTPCKDAGSGLQVVDGVGAGCCLMHRDVAKALGERPYSMERGGEDLDICRKIRQAGYQIWVDWSVACAHTGVMFV